MNKLNEFQEVHRYLKKFEMMQRWMVEDLSRASTFAHANLLVAMGVFNYIEILGSFYKYKEEYKIKGKSVGSGKVRFNFVIKNLLPDEYGAVCGRIDKITKKGSYDALRCGMAHEYLIKTYTGKSQNINLRFTIYGVENQEQYDLMIRSKKCGIELERKKSTYYYLHIFNARLIFDLNLAFEKYKSFLNSDKKGYRKNFLKRVQLTNLQILN